MFLRVFSSLKNIGQINFYLKSCNQFKKDKKYLVNRLAVSNSTYLKCQYKFTTSNNKQNLKTINGQNIGRTSTEKLSQNQQYTLNLDLKNRSKQQQRYKQQEDILLQIDMFIKNKQQILERLKREEKQARQQEQKQKKEKQAQQARREKKQLINAFFKFAVFLFGGLMYLFLPSIFIQNRALRSYGHTSLNIPKQYVDNNFMEKQQKDLIQKVTEKKIKVSAGVPGTGKSTTMKKIVNQMRKQGHIVYYIGLRQKLEFFKFDKLTDELQFILKAAQNKHGDSFLTKEFAVLFPTILKYKKGPIQKKSIKFIIDDIDAIQKLLNQNKDEYKLMEIIEFIYNFAFNKNIDLICISSSSDFVLKMSENSQFAKQVKFIPLQDLNQKDNKDFIKNIIENYDSKKKIHESAKSKLINKQYSVRILTEQIIDQLVNITGEEEQLKFIEQWEVKQMIKLMSITKISFTKQIQKTSMIRLIREIIKSPSQISIDRCLDVNKIFFDQSHVEFNNITSVIQELDKRNMIVFCRPRTELHKKVLEQFLIKEEKRKQEGQAENDF